MKILFLTQLYKILENKSIQTTLWGSTALQIDDDFYKK